MFLVHSVSTERKELKMKNEKKIDEVQNEIVLTLDLIRLRLVDLETMLLIAKDIVLYRELTVIKDEAIGLAECFKSGVCDDFESRAQEIVHKTNLFSEKIKGA